MASFEELLYFSILLGSVGLGWVVAYLPPGDSRRWFSTGVGFFLITAFCGLGAIHAYITILVNALIITKVRDCHKWSMAFTFAYLAFFRSVQFFGLPDTHEFCNAVQLILTLKVIGIAFEVNDTVLRRKGLAPFKNSSPAVTPMNNYSNVAPSALDVVHYSLGFIGLMTGPYYKYKTYDDMVQSTAASIQPRVRLAAQRLKMLPVYVTGFLLMSTAFSQSKMWDPEFLNETSLGWRILYLVGLFLYFRLKFYIAWVLAESSCIMAGLGVYPVVCKPKPGQGPTEPEKLPLTVDSTTEYNYDTIYNINEYDVELVPTVRGAMKAWNMTVQYWLAWHIYRRVPIKSIRTIVVMFVSAYWHGLHGGYYVGLLTVPLMLAAEDWVPRDAPRWGKFLNWFIRMRAFEYMSVGFMCLTYSRTMGYWSSIYFVGHVIAVLFVVGGNLYKKSTGRRKAASSDTPTVVTHAEGTENGHSHSNGQKHHSHHTHAANGDASKTHDHHE
ncbi:Lysophospholipid acyltransferase 7 [Hypsibius exemplaris]|uniref:Lysophospholipid acyltransferase 7 n=1 Tax=Hypsibius exemplaris TaxID=2072580 RepID=A0A1W0WN76_HYPEX|nr:Lysophospholipid acyltransferase 7 [Hypsibius exemplaris]